VVLRRANCLLNWGTDIEGGRSSNIDNRKDGAATAIVCVGGCAAQNWCSKLSSCDSFYSCGLICLPFAKVAMEVLVYVAHDRFQ
jgi:hypothetical protein